MSVQSVILCYYNGVVDIVNDENEVPAVWGSHFSAAQWVRDNPTSLVSAADMVVVVTADTDTGSVMSSRVKP